VKIHHVHQDFVDRWVTDPNLGVVKRHELVMKPSSIDSIALPDGRTFSRAADGSFDVDAITAKHFLAMPGWQEGPSPFPDDDMEPEPEEVRPPRVSKARTSRS